MKKLINLLFIFFSSTTFIFTQTLNVHKIDGTIIQVELGNIDSISFSTQSVPQCPPTVTYGGQEYSTVQIGEQCWFKENLNVGVMISATDIMTDNGIIEKICQFNDENNCNEKNFGGLYRWNEAMQYSTLEGGQGICPDGWHIPSHAEYQILLEAVNNSGQALRSTSGFSALLTGSLLNDSGHFNESDAAYFWSSSSDRSSNLPGFLMIQGWDNGVYFIEAHDENASICVRCLKD